jgi:hypothetical protein
MQHIRRELSIFCASHEPGLKVSTEFSAVIRKKTKESVLFHETYGVSYVIPCLVWLAQLIVYHANGDF